MKVDSPFLPKIAIGDFVTIDYSQSHRDSSKITLISCTIMLLFQSLTTTFPEDLAIAVFTRLAVINAIAVADVEAISGAEAPKRVLHEPRIGYRALKALAST